jgi:hypothetical protein
MSFKPISLVMKRVVICLMMVAFAHLSSFAQMNTWGLFGGGKLTFPSATSAPIYTSGAGGIPAPIINGVQAWPQYWRGFNAAYDENGTLLFYVLTAISTSSINTPSAYGAIFNANGNQLAKIEGSGRTVAIVAYPEDCGKYLVLYHEEETSTNSGYSDGIVYGAELIVS